MNEDTVRLDSLGLPDLNASGQLADEFYNVDDFFSGYLAELSSHSKRTHDGSLLPDAKHARYGASETMPVVTIPIQHQGEPQPPPPLPNGSALLMASQAPTIISRPTPANPNLAAQQLLLQQLQLQHQQQQRTQLQQQQQQQFHAQMQQLAACSDGAASPGGRNKHAKQQEANKVAQQRYRERKKQRYQEMERTVEELQAQLQALKALQQRNTMLEGMNTELSKSLIEKEREVDRLKVVLDTQADDSLGISSESAGGQDVPHIAVPKHSSLATPASTDVANCVPCDVLPRDLTGIDFKSGFADQMEALEAFMKEHNMENADGQGTNVPPELICQLGAVVGRCCQLCQAAIRAEGVRVLDLIVVDPKSLSTVDSGERSRWETALSVMALTTNQQEQLLLLRRSHLDKVREIYKERQSLNLEAMALMLPSHGRDPTEDNTLEGRMASMATTGYLSIAKSNAQLADVLDRIKDNLRREQRAVMDLNCCTISKILTPIQAARYMRAVYPHHCDALALSNVLAVNLNRTESGASIGAPMSAGSCGALAGACVPDGGNCC